MFYEKLKELFDGKLCTSFVEDWFEEDYNIDELDKLYEDGGFERYTTIDKDVRRWYSRETVVLGNGKEFIGINGISDSHNENCSVSNLSNYYSVFKLEREAEVITRYNYKKVD